MKQRQTLLTYLLKLQFWSFPLKTLTNLSEYQAEQKSESVCV